jgi:hypothetical protein
MPHRRASAASCVVLEGLVLVLVLVLVLILVLVLVSMPTHLLTPLASLMSPTFDMQSEFHLFSCL